MLQIIGGTLMFGFAGFIGYTVIVFGLSHPESGWGKIVTEYWPFPVPEWIEEKIAQRRAKSRDELAKVLEEAPTGTSRVKKARVDTVITITGEQTVVGGAGKLLELKFYGADKEKKVHFSPSGKKLREFTIVTMTDGGLLTQQPEGEGKSQKFFLYENCDSKIPRAFPVYLKGTPSSPGPVAKFAKSEQSSDEFIEVAGKRWQLEDIVWADLQVDSGKVFVGPSSSMPRFVMILARNASNRDEWLLWMESRSGGLDASLWIGRQFDPEVEVRDY